MVLHLVPLLPEALVRAAEQAPEAEDVKAGWVAFAIFIALAVAVALLGRSLATRLRNAEASREAGRYDESAPRRRPGAAPQRPQPGSRQPGSSDEPTEGPTDGPSDGPHPRA